MTGTFKIFIARIVTAINYILNKLFKFTIIRSVDASMVRKRDSYVYNDFDYIRVSSLELLAEEINDRGIVGNVAELGVYRGDFAEKINLAFKNRKLYLFDTFEGFADKDKTSEHNNKYSPVDQDFSNTNADLVLRKMKYPENCVIKKGYFPDTANGVEDQFCFVSIDADLYQPIYEGLKFFYPRMESGGCIFVHDYNNDKVYKGAKAAVKRFADENKIFYFPLSDAWGSVVFVKP